LNKFSGKSPIKKFGNMKVICLLVLLQICFIFAHQNVIEEYVNRPDSTFTYSHHSTINVTGGGEAYVLSVTSQTWLSTNEVSQPVWKHWVVIIKPRILIHLQPLVYIGGSNSRMQAPTTVPRDFGLAAAATQSMVILIYQVPFQPVSFHAEPRDRVEDGKKFYFHIFQT
jgi:PhoPQ-activated pathogenicity-related protein